jgi:hypothetical protein
MFTRRWARPAAVLALALLVPPGAAGAGEPDAFPPPLPRGTEITVLRPDSSRTRATFLGEGSTPDRILLEEPRTRARRAGKHYELARDQVSGIEARPFPGFDPSRGVMFIPAGVILGGMVGAVVNPGYKATTYNPAPMGPAGIATVAPDAPQNSRVSNIATGMAIGAVAGVLCWILSTPTRGPVQRFRYDEPAPGPVPALVDTVQVPQR